MAESDGFSDDVSDTHASLLCAGSEDQRTSQMLLSAFIRRSRNGSSKMLSPRTSKTRPPSSFDGSCALLDVSTKYQNGDLWGVYSQGDC